MARNRIQFQKGLSEGRFQALYGDEEACRALVVAWRWPNSFMCSVSTHNGGDEMAAPCPPLHCRRVGGAQCRPAPPLGAVSSGAAMSRHVPSQRSLSEPMRN